MTQSDEEYWSDYDGLQHVKHQILQRYLGGWFPKLTSANGAVLYLDTHAGRGIHKTGNLGSPILALQVLLGHRMKEQILRKAEVYFSFFENNETNYHALEEEISKVGVLPSKIHVRPFFQDYEATLRAEIQKVKASKQTLAPAFAFIDPYSFDIPMDLLNDLLGFPKCELFLNFMLRQADMGISNPSLQKNMDAIFGSSKWTGLKNIADYEKRAMSIIEFHSSQLNAKYATHMLMRGENGTIKYVLIHATNHPDGRVLMKDAMWTFDLTEVLRLLRGIGQSN